MAVVEGIPQLSMSLFMKVRALNSLWTKRIAETSRDNWKLEVHEVLVLIVAENYPQSSQADIGSRLSIHPNIMSSVGSRLRKRRLITVTKDPHDGRKQIISLTSSGLDMVREIRARNPEMTLQLDPMDRQRLEEIVTRILNAERNGDQG